MLSSAAALLLLYSLLRLTLLAYNHDLIGSTPIKTFGEALLTGFRFDLRAVVYACLPLLLAVLSARAMAWRGLQRAWLTIFASLALLLGLVELDFYREFHQRLNGLVFQYLGADPKTALSMVWYGFPVPSYLLGWALSTCLLAWGFKGLDLLSRPQQPALSPGAVIASPAWYWRGLTFGLGLLVAVAAARGTLRQGPPLRWGDAFTTDSAFANQLALNGTLTLVDAARHRWSSSRNNVWNATLPEGEALQIVRDMLLTPEDRLVDADQAAVRRVFTPRAVGALPIRNVVVILMESFAGHYVGALGSPAGITPHFDRLAGEGLLFTHFFANGTHTHQGLFATMACFPNLPGFEYLMQQPEGMHRFSGLPQLLGPRGFADLYVYNGDFAWDNQAGFFSNQGMTTFIGRNDYVNPVFSDRTWGVSDQDMFDRALAELARIGGQRPFYALLQTLSNHTPYALPKDLPVAPVTDHGGLNEHLTAMRYADWALGQFFAKARAAPYFKDTLFVVLGDHGFAGTEQLTDIDLYRFHVPLLLIGPDVQRKFGHRRDLVGTQVDIVPTVMGRLGAPVRHQCWGRDLLSLTDGDEGFGVIKPSGSDQTVAIVAGGRILVQPKGQRPRLYDYRLGTESAVRLSSESRQRAGLQKRLEAFLQTSTRSLLGNTAGATPGGQERTSISGRSPSP